jgi:hypothetical protein
MLRLRFVVWLAQRGPPGGRSTRPVSAARAVPLGTPADEDRHPSPAPFAGFSRSTASATDWPTCRATPSSPGEGEPGLPAAGPGGSATAGPDGSPPRVRSGLTGQGGASASAVTASVTVPSTRTARSGPAAAIHARPARQRARLTQRGVGPVRDPDRTVLTQCQARAAAPPAHRPGTAAPLVAAAAVRRGRGGGRPGAARRPGCGGAGARLRGGDPRPRLRALLLGAVPAPGRAVASPVTTAAPPPPGAADRSAAPGDPG